MITTLLDGSRGLRRWSDGARDGLLDGFDRRCQIERRTIVLVDCSPAKNDFKDTSPRMVAGDVSEQTLVDSTTPQWRGC
jgi:hypothetical protein